MEIKRVYMDLVEGIKGKKGVWKLESEAFKKPIELQIHYDNTELQQFNTKISDIHKILEQNKMVINELQKKIEKLEEKQEHLLNGYMTNVNGLSEIIEIQGTQDREISWLSKQLGNQNNTIETQSGTILHQADKINEIEKKITKQPMVYSDKCFVSGHEMVGIAELNVPSGEYLVISQFIVGEHNEYVENKDEILFEKVNVSDGYIVWYELVGGTELDTPTATIFYNLVFIPC